MTGWRLLFFILAVPCSIPAQTPQSGMPADMPAADYLRGVPPDSIIRGYLCPMHPGVTAEQAGQTCYLCGMALVDGRIKMPHASHEPHYGGLFFMSRNNWHHIEGALPEPGVFRFYLYDNYSNPMPVLHASGRLVLQEFRDENGDEVRPPVHVPLVPSPDGVSFAVADNRLQLGRDFHVRIRFRPDQAEEDRFDFAFYAYSHPEADTAARAGASSGTLVIPDTPEGILHAMVERAEHIQTLIGQSRLNELFLPALEAKDLALALADHPGSLDEAGVASLNHAVKTIVKAGWLLDTYGDLGDRPGAEAAFRMMSAGIAQVNALYP
jgi:hypothetical protein